VHTHTQEVEQAVTDGEMSRAPHDTIEEYLREQGQEWSRRMLEAQLRFRADREQRVGVVGADGIERGTARATERHLESVVGRVAVPRLAYQQAGCEEVEELAVRGAQDFDEFYKHRKLARDPTPDLLVISTDGKGIVMRHEDLREATRRVAEKSTHKLETRLSPGEKPNRKRMAQVATVYTVPAWPRTAGDVVHTFRDEDTESKRPKTRDERVWASVQKHAHGHPRRVR